MKKIRSIIISAFLLCSILSVVSFADGVKPVTVTLNGNKVDCAAYGQEPTIVEGRTLVPLRAIFEALGASVEWDASTRTVSSTLGDTTVKLTIGEKVLYKNGNAVTLDVPATIMNDRTLVPARAVAESFGVEVSWDAISRNVILEFLIKPQKPDVGDKDFEIKAEIPEEALTAAETFMDYVVSLDFNSASKLAVDSDSVFYGMDVSSAEDFLALGGLDEQSLVEMLSDAEATSDMIAAYAPSIAGPSYDFLVDVMSYYDYKVTDSRLADDGTVEFDIEIYEPDISSLEEVDIDAVFTKALTTAFSDGLLTSGMTTEDIIKVTSGIMERALTRQFNEMLGEIELVLCGKITIKAEKVDGTWKISADGIADAMLPEEE